MGRVWDNELISVDIFHELACHQVKLCQTISGNSYNETGIFLIWEWKTLKLGRHPIVHEKSFDPARGNYHFIQPLISVLSIQHVWNTAGPMQAKAYFQSLLYLYVTCGELWIGDLHKSKLHWFLDFPLIVANQQSYTTSLDTLCSQTFFALGIATGFLCYVYLCVPFSGKAARSSPPLDLQDNHRSFVLRYC